MTGTLAARAARRMRQILTTLLVVVGTTVSLLLAHSLEQVHPAEFANTALVVPIADASAEVERAADAAAAEAENSATTPRNYLGMACFVIFLLALMRLRRPLGALSLAPRARWLAWARRPEAPPRPVTLISLCISRT